jgi:membrane protein implicated in regulation of membrane protease activity
MQELLRDPVNAWLTAGALIIAFEAFTAPGLGLFLGGLGALCTALLIRGGVVDQTAIPAQFAWCFGLTVGWAALLWKPLRKFRMHRKSRSGEMKNNNLIGETALVAKGGLKPGRLGQVTWSGTVWNAELESSHARELAEGEKVRIQAVSGNTLKVISQEG